MFSESTPLLYKIMKFITLLPFSESDCLLKWSQVKWNFHSLLVRWHGIYSELHSLMLYCAMNYYLLVVRNGVICLYAYLCIEIANSKLNSSTIEKVKSLDEMN